jgi:hypothetical protein
VRPAVENPVGIHFSAHVDFNHACAQYSSGIPCPAFAGSNCEHSTIGWIVVIDKREAGPDAVMCCCSTDSSRQDLPSL